MLDILFSPEDCILHKTRVADILLAQKQLFLSKAAYHKFRGYAYSNFKRYSQTDTSKAANEKRATTIEHFGYDTKAMTHIVRLMLECEQILSEHTLDIRRDKEVLKSIRRGEWSLDRIVQFFEQKDKHLESLYQSSTLRYAPDEAAIRKLLLDCLEEHYGSLDAVIQKDTTLIAALTDMRAVLEKYSG